jgi:hypothetical protein
MADDKDVQQKPWRKRHRVLSRVLLFGLGALLVAGLVLLYFERKEQDKQDRWDYLEARLAQLDLVLLKDPSGAEVEKILGEEFGDEDLPARLRHGALRAHAAVSGVRGDFDGALVLLTKARHVAPGSVERFATSIEAARVHVEAGRAAMALGLLEDAAPGGQPVLAIWRAIVRAEAHAADGRPGDARSTLNGALDALPRPLPDGPVVTVALSPWTPGAAAHLATRELVDSPGSKPSGEPWRRLLELAPEDFDVAVSVAKAHLDLGFEAEARAAWRRAESLAPAKAAELADNDPTLAGLRDGTR